MTLMDAIPRGRPPRAETSGIQSHQREIITRVTVDTTCYQRIAGPLGTSRGSPSAECLRGHPRISHTGPVVHDTRWTKTRRRKHCRAIDAFNAVGHLDHREFWCLRSSRGGELAITLLHQLRRSAANDNVTSILPTCSRYILFEKRKTKLLTSLPVLKEIYFFH